MKRWDSVVASDPPQIIRDGDIESNREAKFFFDPSEIPSLALLMQDLIPDAVQDIKERADRICHHRFDLLGYKNLDYGPVIDWHLDVVNGKRAPRKAWYKVAYLNFSEVGDHKVVWELNRHQHLVTLAKAYCLTGDERFVKELYTQWYQWKSENPYPVGINWCSSLEVSFRTLSWLWIFHLLEDCPVLPATFQSDLLGALAQNGNYISRYLSTYFSPNTHLLGEAVALFFLGILCPAMPNAQEWQKKGWDTLLTEAEVQVDSDGVYFEQSTYYHVYALDLFLHARVLAECNNWSIPSIFDHIIERMAGVLAVLGQSGTLPRIGDDDGGRVFDPARNRAAHLLDPLSTAAVLFGRPDFKSASLGLCEETLWLLGANGAARFAELPLVSPENASCAFESSGLYLMASDSLKAQLVVRAGQMGASTAGHSHCDLLSLSLSVAGRECLVDPGTYRYVSEIGERDQFRGTSAHNTVRIDRCDQAKARDSFSWDFIPAVRIQHWMQGRTFDLLAAEHSGYRRLNSPATHSRWVVFMKPHFWFVRDVIEGEGRHFLEVFWHLAPDVDWTTDGSNTFLALNNVGAECALTLVSKEDNNWSSAIRRGSYSPAYGKKTENSVLEFSKESECPCEFATVLFPGTATAARLTGLASPYRTSRPSNVTGYRFEERVENHYFFFANCGEAWVCQNWASDASFFYARTNGNAEVVHWVLCNGSFAEFNGRRMFDNQCVVTRYEWHGPADSPEVWRSDQEVARKTERRGPLAPKTVDSDRNSSSGNE